MCEPKSGGGAETSFRPPFLESEGASAPLAPPVPTPMEDEAGIFVVCRNCVHLFQYMQVTIDFFKSWTSCFTLYYKFISVFNTMTCPGSPACPWISPFLCFWHCHCHWKMCQLRGWCTKKRKKRKPLITGGFQGNLISQINATSVTKSWNAVSSVCTVCLFTIFCPSQKVVLDPF